MPQHQSTPPLYRPAPVQLPRLAHVRQHFDHTHLADVRATVAAGFARHTLPGVGPGSRVAITAGSRGIANIAAIIAAVADELRARGAVPFVVAAMGSHGGASADGQRAVLASYGVTEVTVGCSVVCTVEDVALGATAEGVPVFCNRAAYEADAVIVLNRVKPHSILVGALGSGLMKMAAVGLGGPRGAAALHRSGLAQHLLPAARLALARAPLVLGVAIVENAHDQIRTIAVVPPAEIEATDRQLLAEARALLPTIPFDPIDVLVVDQIGKNFSGTCLDPNVIGMHRRLGGAPEREIGCIVALDLSDESHGNANGVGMADIITEQLRRKIDWHATYTNALTGGFLAGIKLPLACATAREAVQLALRPFAPETVRVVRIRTTAQLEDLWVSPTLLAELGRYPAVEQVGKVEELWFEE